jgi:hypothetical protein
MSYFIIKAPHWGHFLHACKTSSWSVPFRKSLPKTHRILNEALAQGPVTLIFSINGFHAFQGYATLQEEVSGEYSTNKEGSRSMSPPFAISWVTKLLISFIF